MKETSLYEIREEALKSGRMVFSSLSLSALIAKKRKVAKAYMTKLVNAGFAKKLVRGKISFTDDGYIIATQLFEPSYVSLFSALNFHGLTQQIPRNIQCVNRKVTIAYSDLGIEYHKISAQLFFGYKSYKRGESYTFVADKEKAILDGIYLELFDKSDLEEIIKKLDTKILIEYSQNFNKKIQRMVMEACKK